MSSTALTPQNKLAKCNLTIIHVNVKNLDFISLTDYWLNTRDTQQTLQIREVMKVFKGK